MNLSYTLPKAEENIIAGVKIHTLREDRSNRWQPGKTIHHCYSFRSERGYHCFLKNECKSVQQVLLILVDGFLHVRVDRQELNQGTKDQFIKNDGFETEVGLVNWFFPPDEQGERKKTLWAGKIIHWTDFKY